MGMGLVALFAAWAGAEERLYVNDKEVPENRHDLEVIQQAVTRRWSGRARRRCASTWERVPAPA